MWFLNSIEWTISPVIFSLGPVQLRYYGLLFALGFYLSYYLVQRFYSDANVNPQEVEQLTFYTILGTVIGARLGHVFFYEWEIYSQNLLDIFKIWQGGLASHGGALGILISSYLYSRKYKRNYLWILDRIAIPTALTGALIRMGNLMNSEIYGTPTQLPWGFIFVNNGETLPKHPTQIYEAIAYLISFVILYLIYNRRKAATQNGLLTGWFFILIFSFRFIIEFIKNPQVSKEVDLLINYGQFLSIPFVLTGIALVIYSKKLPQNGL
jgi:prolipoprotein diacylglyceryl transferase